MATVVFCPVTFNLAETTRMIEVARALDGAHRPVYESVVLLPPARAMSPGAKALMSLVREDPLR